MNINELKNSLFSEYNPYSQNKGLNKGVKQVSMLNRSKSGTQNKLLLTAFNYYLEDPTFLHENNSKYIQLNVQNQEKTYHKVVSQARTGGKYDCRNRHSYSIDIDHIIHTQSNQLKTYKQSTPKPTQFTTSIQFFESSD